jgi:hypothetical protein
MSGLLQFEDSAVGDVDTGAQVTEGIAGAVALVLRAALEHGEPHLADPELVGQAPVLLPCAAEALGVGAGH